MAGSTDRPGGTVAGHYVERAGGTAFSVNGQRQTANQYLIDGFMDKEVQHGTNAVEPIIDALREFRVQSSNYTAEFGTEAGGQINAVLKSGTNEFHGSAWEFLRNNNLDANNFFNNRAGVAIPEFRRNQFGVAGGGPVILPKYNGRNRTFIFGAYEGTRIRKGITQLSTVPNAALRGGDFNGAGVVNDPLTGQPFAGDRVPASRISPITNTILQKWVPQPNNSNPVFNWISTDPQKLNTEQYDWRIDHRISDRDSIFGHYIFEDNDFRLPKLFPTDGAAQKLRGQNLTAAWTHLFGAATMNEFRIGYSRFRENEFQARAGVENVVSELGMSGLCENPKCWGIPQMNVTGFASFGEHGGQNVSGPRGWRNEVYAWQDAFYKTIGSHSVKAGAEVRRHRDTFPEAIYPRGIFGYDGTFSSSPFGDYLLGIPHNVQSSIDIFDPHMRNTFIAPWVQDDWRVSKTFTLNLGLRYEWSGRPVSDDGSIASVEFSNGTATLATGRNPDGLPPSLLHNDNNNFAPRVGFAWNPQFGHGHTVLRGAYGIFYQREPANTWIDIAINPPFIRQTLITLDNTPSSPFYFTKYSLNQPVALGTAVPLLVFSIDPNWRDGLVQQWNFNIQHDLGYNTVLQVGYVGNHGYHMAREIFPNQPDPGPGPILPRRPYPNFGTINGLDSGGSTIYHGLQIQAEKRYSNGMQFIAGYTFSKCISDSDSTFVGEGTSVQNGRDFRQQRGLCTQNIANRLTVSWVYDIPFGRGRLYGKTISRPADLIAGGWQINGIFTARDGSPFTVTQPGDFPNQSDGSARPNEVGKPNQVSNWSIYNAFNTTAFAPAARYVWGNAGRNTVIGPGLNNWDFSLFKNFNIDEVRKLQFRAEFFNLMNHADFGFPGSSIGTAQFGQISGTAQDPRDVQLSLKFLW
ncbi:MAG TPA: hypothetical protein VEU62_00945, partial [Bryobacterales bacterium]|nr:hypothetical protein [Bryobacterales bacterium]